MKLIEAALSKHLPVMGICLGAQLIAKTLGAAVYPNQEKEIGWYDVSPTDHAQSDPLLGAFSFASGAVMMTNILDPKKMTGFPIGSIIGGNPLLEGVWFFGNGMVCFKTSYDFFMIALDGQEDVEKMVTEIKGLLPASP